MKRVYLTFFFLLAIYTTIQAQDPQGGPDSAYVVCTPPRYNPHSGKTELTFQLRYHIDNTGSNKVAGVQSATFKITGDNVISIDTTVGRTFSGSGMEHFSILVVTKEYDPNPTIPPFWISFGAVNFTGGVTGDSILANIIVSINDTGTVCIDTVHTAIPESHYTSFVTESAIGYLAKWSGPYCCPVSFLVPTLTEWGIFAFTVFMLGLLVFYLRKHRKLKESLTN